MWNHLEFSSVCSSSVGGIVGEQGVCLSYLHACATPFLRGSRVLLLYWPCYPSYSYRQALLRILWLSVLFQGFPSLFSCGYFQDDLFSPCSVMLTKAPNRCCSKRYLQKWCGEISNHRVSCVSLQRGQSFQRISCRSSCALQFFFCRHRLW